MTQRLVTAFAMLPVVLVALAEPTGLFLLPVLLLVALLCHRELARLANSQNQAVPWLPLLTSVALVLLFYKAPLAPSYLLTLGCLAILSSLGMATVYRGAEGAWTQISSFWIFAGLLPIFVLHQMFPPTHFSVGSTPVTLALFATWAGDTAAIFVGGAFGKTPLAQKISPSKTVEGSIGYLLGSMLFALCFSFVTKMPLVACLAVGFVAGIMGQLGDLFESIVKRKAGKKDSGSLLPGHGGMLDRADSVLVSAPILALLVALLFGR